MLPYITFRAGDRNDISPRTESVSPWIEENGKTDTGILFYCKRRYPRLHYRRSDVRRNYTYPSLYGNITTVGSILMVHVGFCLVFIPI